jgi:hypothetical protein
VGSSGRLASASTAVLPISASLISGCNISHIKTLWHVIPHPNRKVNNLYNNIIYLQIVTLSLIAVYIKNWN